MLSDVSLFPAKCPQCSQLVVLRDLEAIEKRESKLTTQARSGDKEIVAELEIIKQLREFIETGNSVRNFPADESSAGILKELSLLTSKPVLYVCNVNEDEVPEAKDNPEVKKVREYADKFKDKVIIVCAKIESEIAELDKEEKDWSKSSICPLR